MRLARGGKVLSYSGDTEWTDALIPIADGADLFIIECYDYSRDVTGHMNFAAPEGEARQFCAPAASCSPT